MKKEEFADILNDIDEEYIARAHDERRIAKVLPVKKFLSVLAAVIILAATATMVIAAVMNIEYKGASEWLWYDGEERYAYRLVITVGKVPEDSFGENVDSVRPELMEKANDHRDCLITEDGRTVHSCGYVVKEFTARGEAAEWLGYDAVTIVDFPDAGHAETLITVRGDDFEPESGRISEIIVNSEWKKGDISFSTTAEINTDISGKTTYNYHEEIPEGSKAESEYLTTGNGTKYIVIRISPGYGKNTAYIKGKLVKDGILYSFEAYAGEEQLPECEKILKTWADNF